MKKILLRRLSAAVLAVTMLALPAQALTVEQAGELLEQYYIDPVSPEVLNQTTIEAMLEALGDPYTQYFTAEEYAEFLASMEDGNIVGIGITGTACEEGLRISVILEDSPAQAAGLQAGDILTQVDGHKVAGEALETVTGWIQGEEGTQVTVRYLRDGAEHELTLTRAAIVIPATTTDLLDGHIGYITCTTFGSDTAGHMEEGITTYGSQADHWIVDLRGNGGGLTQAAVDSVGLFAGAGTVGYLRDGQGKYYAFASEGGAKTIEPVIVLSDPYTASSSELFSKAVGDLGCGIVIGERTYGKGVAQTLMDETNFPDLFPDGSAMKITTDRFFSSKGATNDVVGVIPDLLVPAGLADDVAYLLSASSPTSDTTGYYRVDLEWRWYIDKDLASQPEWADAMAALLEALPPTTKVWEGTGGSSGWQSTSVEKIAQDTGVTVTDRSFTDTEDSPYAQAIDLLATYDILSGTGNGAFEPEGTLTRAQLCALLAQALNCTVPSGESAFSDVSMDSWYGPAVNALAKMGLVSGVGDGTFRPDDPVNHEQFISILGRLAQYLNINFYEDAKAMPADATKVVSLLDYSAWARDEVWLLALSQQGYFGNTISLLWDDLENIEPQGTTTREEAAALLYQVLVYTDVFPV